MGAVNELEATDLESHSEGISRIYTYQNSAAGIDHTLIFTILQYRCSDYDSDDEDSDSWCVVWALTKNGILKLSLGLSLLRVRFIRYLLGKSRVIIVLPTYVSIKWRKSALLSPNPY